MLTLVAAAAVSPVMGATNLTQLRQQWNKTARDMDQIRAMLRPIKAKQRTYTHQLTVAQNRLEITRRSLRDIQSQLRDTRLELEQVREELTEAERRLDERRELLATRLIDTYKHGSVSYLNVVLGAGDFWDLLNRGYIVRSIVQKDSELMEQIRQDKEQIEAYKVQLEEKERVRAELEREHLALTHSARSQAVECRQILTEINRDRVKYEQALAELEQTSSEIGAMIRRMQARPQSPGSSSRIFGGRFIMPVVGRKTSGFGMRFHPILKQHRLHTGVDYAAPTGTPIKAAAKGEVIYSGTMRGYGNTVIIDHGSNVQTVYAHCSRLLTRAGATVNQGQVIAHVGSTGWSTGPHLHFEVRRNGVPVNPGM